MVDNDDDDGCWSMGIPMSLKGSGELMMVDNAYFVKSTPPTAFSVAF